MTDDRFCLRWNNHHPNLIAMFSSLLKNDQMVDVTLISENREIHAHKIVLSACSPFFQVCKSIFFCSCIILKSTYALISLYLSTCRILFCEIHVNIQLSFLPASNIYI